jgi:membrane peptidoglycan carboxypeptidase
MRNLVSELVGTTSGIVNGLRIVVAPPRARRALGIGGWILCLSVLAVPIWLEMRTAWLQSHILSAISAKLTFEVQQAPSAQVRYPSAGPYDRRLGYTRLPVFQENLKTRGFDVRAQARLSWLLRSLSDLRLFAVYPAKSQAGLQLLDREGRALFARQYPERVYQNFETIPALIVDSLLFIENRELLDATTPRRNPAVEWDRFVQAFRDVALQPIRPAHSLSGGSTLATQLEKVRHSPGGRTASPMEKLRQMTSASLRAYRDGEETMTARRQIVCDYLNSLPLASQPGFGEVIGLGDGLWAWFGADFTAVNLLLGSPARQAPDQFPVERGIAYRQAVSLLLAIKKPSFYLRQDWTALNRRVDVYLRLFSQAGVVPPTLRDAALNARLKVRERAPAAAPVDFMENKAGDSIRADLLRLLGMESTYDLDRLDLTVRTTLDDSANGAAARMLNQLSDPSHAIAAGLTGERLLNPEGLDSVIYSFTLFERTPTGNLLRVQVDNLNQPLNVNRGTKLELGSTAKLRTLATYLEIISELHGKYSTLDLMQSKPVLLNPQDHLSHWAIEYLASASDRSLSPMLEAAMNRTYPANPNEKFFTGGGLHQFANFDSRDNGRVMTVREAFQRSVNLVFIRLMRDLVSYYMFREGGVSAAILEDENDSARSRYLSRFADWEGKEFLGRFWRRYAPQTPDDALKSLINRLQPTPRRLAVIYRSVRPEADFDEFERFITAHSGTRNLSRGALEELYRKYGPEQFSLSDRGYLAGVHPLELWMLEYRHANPNATLADVEAASVRERQEVYQWLFKSGRKHAQDRRIRTLLEMDVFQEIHAGWKRLGYPFPSLVPSYATAIGSSGDNPAALAELAGILLYDGLRYPVTRIHELRFASDTPFETVMRARRGLGEQVLSPLIARKLRQELVGVVEHGTARRAFQSVVLPNGRVVEVGGKTGTGDNRLHTYSAGGAPLRSQPLNRTAAFVFFIGDRFFGTVVAYVPGADAGSYHFTSALPVQVFKQLILQIRPLLVRTMQES